MFDWLFDGLTALLSFYFDLTGSIGVAIILLTITVMLITSPLTMKGTRSMMKMQRLQPEMKRIQEKHKGDREKMNQELMAFYQEKGINPVSGCLPLLIQMPVFFVLFQVLRGLGNTSGGQPAPKYLDHTSDLYQKIVDAGGQLISWGFDLADAATSSHDSIVDALPYYFLILLTAGTAWFTQRQAMGRRDPNQPMSQQQQMMSRIMIFFLPLISLSIPAGVVIYFVFSNLFRIGQQWLIHYLETQEREREDQGPSPKSGSDSSPAHELVEDRPDVANPNPTSAPKSPAPSRSHPRSKKKKRKKRRR
jgi:YidC/Oxa1 family membrane protein insertase